MSEENLEVVTQAMMDELEVFGGIPFDVAMDLFKQENFPNMEYYRLSRGIDNDHNVFYKFIKHINGEPQFKAQKPKKWIVRSKEPDEWGKRWYVKKECGFLCLNNYGELPYKFDTKEEALKYATPQCEVVEVEE